jgi:hypothetical protein
MQDFFVGYLTILLVLRLQYGVDDRMFNECGAVDGGKPETLEENKTVPLSEPRILQDIT